MCPRREGRGLGDLVSDVHVTARRKEQRDRRSVQPRERRRHALVIGSESTRTDYGRSQMCIRVNG